MQFFTVLAVMAAMLMAAEARLPKSLQKRWGFMDTPEFLQGAQRIVNGEKAEVGDAPFQTSIQQDYFGIVKSHICGGSLINKRTIVTAAHCTDKQSTSQIINRYGTMNQKQAGPDGDKKTSRFVMHKDYDSNTIKNDIALIILSADVNPSANIAFVDYDDHFVQGGQDVTVYGWGLTVGGGQQVPEELMRGHLKTMTNADCHAKWGEVNAIADGMLCAFDRNDAIGATTACNGDSGGPLIQVINGKKMLVGLVSWGENGCKATMPNVYTRISTYVDWIKTNMQN